MRQRGADAYTGAECGKQRSIPMQLNSFGYMFRVVCSHWVAVFCPMRLSIGIVGLLILWVCVGCESEIAKRIRETKEELRICSDYETDCVLKVLEHQTADSITTPQIAFCAIAPDGRSPDPNHPTSLIYISYVCDRGAADGVIIKSDQQEEKYTLSGADAVAGVLGYSSPVGKQIADEYNLTTEPVVYGTFESIDHDYSYSCHMDSNVKLSIALSKKGEPISPYVSLEPAIHQGYGDSEKVMRVYPDPGNVREFPHPGI